jgi:hypothetical protein
MALPIGQLPEERLGCRDRGPRLGVEAGLTGLGFEPFGGGADLGIGCPASPRVRGIFGLLLDVPGGDAAVGLDDLEDLRLRPAQDVAGLDLGATGEPGEDGDPVR